MSTVVKFGTDGWRGIIADDFTYENVRVAARAIAHYVIEQRTRRPACASAMTRASDRGRLRAWCPKCLQVRGFPWRWPAR